MIAVYRMHEGAGSGKLPAPPCAPPAQFEQAQPLAQPQAGPQPHAAAAAQRHGAQVQLRQVQVLSLVIAGLLRCWPCPFTARAGRPLERSG
jgi:hypothetical protein